MKRLLKLFTFKWLGKKSLLIGGATILVVGTFVLILTLNFGSTSLKQTALDNISEARFFMMQAHNENLRVQFFSGVREQSYQIDGIATGTVPFALLNVEPRNISHIDDQELRGTLQLGDAPAEEVVLERNLYGRNFAVDLGKAVEANVAIVFTLTTSTDTITFNLSNSMADDAIDWKKALEIATEHVADSLNNVTSFETYVKIITDLQNLGAFWFVQFATNTGETYFVVINPTGEIIGGHLAAS